MAECQTESQRENSGRKRFASKSVKERKTSTDQTDKKQTETDSLLEPPARVPGKTLNCGPGRTPKKPEGRGTQ